MPRRRDAGIPAAGAHGTVGWGGGILRLGGAALLGGATMAAGSALAQTRPALRPVPSVGTEIPAARDSAPTVLNPVLPAQPLGPLTQAWTIVPSIDVVESFDDNVNQLPRGQEQSDFFTTIAPGVAVRGNTRRLKLALDYTAEKLIYHRVDRLNRLNHIANGTATLEVLPEHFFIDALGSVSQQAIRNTGTVSAVPETANPDNQTTVKTYTVSPYWRDHFGGFADTELRYGFNQYYSGTSLASDTTSHTFSAQAYSGSDFTRLLWTAQASDSETHIGESSEVLGGLALSNLDASRRLVQFAPEYVVNSYFSLLGSAGYEQIDDPTLINKPNGAIGSAGFRLRPGPRTALTAQINHRFDRNYFTGDVAYKISATSTFTASYTEDTQSTQSLAAQDLNFLTTDEFGNFIDTRTARQFQIGNSAFSLTTAAFIQKRFESRLNYALGRNQFNALAFNERRFTELTNITEKDTGVSLNYGRELSSVNNLNVTLRFLNTDFGTSDGRKDQLYGGSTGLLHRFTETLSGSVSYNILVRDSNLPASDTVENIVSVGLHKSF